MHIDKYVQSYILSNSSKIIFIYSWCLTRLKVAMVIKVINVNRHWLILKPTPTSFLVAPSTNQKKHSNQCYYQLLKSPETSWEIHCFQFESSWENLSTVSNPPKSQWISIMVCDVVYVVYICFGILILAWSLMINSSSLNVPQWFIFVKDVPRYFNLIGNV